ncbi:hypothetical protein [Chryseobacterium sp.]|uniref:hypothetical protein n=1 Tax=Chryseobacterium sp. TaxID=1871047 RepID=UPI00388FF9AD
MVSKYLFSISLLLLGLLSHAQTTAYLSPQYLIKNVDVTLGDFVITIDSEGNITRFYPKNSDYSVEYYDNDSFDKEKFMRVKMLGNKKIDYYDSYHINSGDFGKLKSIGDIKFEYWNDFRTEKLGKIKSIGNLSIDYWGQDFVDNTKLGKLKSIGNISIDYGRQSYTDKGNFNKVTKFGAVELSYFENQAFDKQKFGKLKSIKGNSEMVSVIVSTSN